MAGVLKPFPLFPGLVLLVAGLGLSGSQVAQAGAELIGIARIPGDVFVPGPVSGQFIDSEDNAELSGILPFTLGQPVQGFSAVLSEGDGSYLVLADNGFGSKQNSPDFVLTLYRIRPDFRTAQGGSGTIEIESAIRLRDPFGHAPFPVIASQPDYPPDGSGVAVDPELKRRSWLTGSDFDPESLQQAPDGTYWIGDEFGPWLLHFDVVGRLQHAPYAHSGLNSPENPVPGLQGRKTQSSGGFEGVAYDKATQRLYAMLEKPLEPDSRLLEIHTFDMASGSFGVEPVMQYALDEGARAAGAFQYLGDGEFAVLERDSGQGETAVIKRIYTVRRGQVDEHGVLRKRLLVDLMDIADPHGLSEESVDGRYSFAYQTIESMVFLDANTLGIINDNNYPFGSGPPAPEATVFILLRLTP